MNAPMSSPRRPKRPRWNGSGLFSVLLVLARTPGINAWLPAGDFFRVALVVHVDLSVLVWFVAIAGLLWTLAARPAASAAGAALHRLPLLLCGAGALGMALAAFTGGGPAVMANYIPMLDSTAFRGAVAVFGEYGGDAVFPHPTRAWTTSWFDVIQCSQSIRSEGIPNSDEVRSHHRCLPAA